MEASNQYKLLLSADVIFTHTGCSWYERVESTGSFEKILGWILIYRSHTTLPK